MKNPIEQIHEDIETTMKKETCIREKTTSSLIMSFLSLIAFAVPSVWAYGEKNSNENGVRIQVTPQVLSPDKIPQFKIRLNTHSVELNQDLKNERYDLQEEKYFSKTMRAI